MKINSLKKQKHGYLIHTWLEKAFKGTVVNGALVGSLEITFKSPFKLKKIFCLVPVNIWTDSDITDASLS